MATPEIVLGASLLTLFVAIGEPPFFPTNFLTILIAHIMFNISYVVVTVRARLYGFDRHLEEAAMDLGANEWTTFWKVTFPMILPGIMAAALLAFSLSIDDYVITSFTAGRTSTFPIFIWGSARVGVPVQVNVIGTAFFLIAVGFVAITTFLQGRANRPLRRRSRTQASRAARRDRTLAPERRPDDGRYRNARRPTRPAAAAPLPDPSVVPPVWGRITNLDRRSRRGLVADHDATASGTSTTRRGSASRTPATPIRASSRRSRRRPRSCSTASRTSCTTSPACGCTTGSRTLLPGEAGARSCRTRAPRRSRRRSSSPGSRPAGRSSSRSATATTAGRPRRWP